jgi:hypothetical protein
MIALLIFALLVVLVCVVLIYVFELLIGLLPGAPAHLRTIVRVIIVLIGLLLIIDRALPLLGAPRLA